MKSAQKQKASYYWIVSATLLAGMIGLSACKRRQQTSPVDPGFIGPRPEISTLTLTPTPMDTPDLTLTLLAYTATATPTYTVSPTGTGTNTFSPTWDLTQTFLAYTSTRTPTWTPTATNTSTSTWTPTWTPTFTSTWTPTSTGTFTWTPTETVSANSRTYTPSYTYTPTISTTYTPTSTHMGTSTPTHTSTFTSTPTHSNTFTSTPTHTSTSTATPTHTGTSTSTFTPVALIDNFEDGDLVSLNSGTLWWGVTEGLGSSITVTNTAPGANASAQSLNATGVLVNNADWGGGKFGGWAEFGTGVLTTDELENLPAATYPHVRFYVKGNFTSTAQSGNRDIYLLVNLDDGDSYWFLLCPYITSAWTLVEFDMTNSIPALSPANPNAAHTFGTEAANIIGWGVLLRTSQTGAGAGTIAETYDISIDDLEFLTGPIAPTPLVGINWVDNVEDGDTANFHCNFPAGYIDAGGMTSFSSLSTVADGANATSTSLEASGTLEYPGASAFSGVDSTLQPLSVSAAIYKNLDFYIKAVFPPPALLFYADFSITINMDDGDTWAIDYVSQCFAGGVNGATWTQVTIDLTDTVSLAPDGAPCITKRVDSVPLHTSFALEDSNIDSISIGPWIWDAPGSEPWNMRLDELRFY